MMKRIKLFGMSLLATLALLLAACGGGGEETAPGAPAGEVPGVTGTEQAVPSQQETQPSAPDTGTEDATEPAAGAKATEAPSETEPMTDTEDATEPAAGAEATETPSDTEPMTDTEDTDTGKTETPPADETETTDDSDAMTDTTETEPAAAAEAGLQSSTVADFSIVTPDDQELGSIEDLVLDPQDGQVKYALVSLDSGVGLTAEVVPIPWDQLDLQEDQQNFVLDVDQQRLQEAPSFEEFPPAQSGWESEVEQYWENNASIGTSGSGESNESQQ